MLTRDQAVEAAFYSGANLYSFTCEREHNLDWMKPAPGRDRMDVKRQAAALVRALPLAVRKTEKHTAATTIAVLRRDGFIVDHDPTVPQIASFYVFCTVLLCCDELIERRRDELDGVFPPGPPPAAAASFEDEEDRIDARHPDPMARITGADRADVPAPPAPAPIPFRKGGKR